MTPAVRDEPSRVTEGEAQVSALSPPALTLGIGLTVTVVVPIELVHPETVAVTEYVPAIAGVAETLTTGSSSADVKPLGPVQL